MRIKVGPKKHMVVGGLCGVFPGDVLYVPHVVSWLSDVDSGLLMIVYRRS